MEDQPFKLVAKINIGLFHTNHEKARRVVKDVADMPYSKARMVKTFQGVILSTMKRYVQTEFFCECTCNGKMWLKKRWFDRVALWGSAVLVVQ